MNEDVTLYEFLLHKTQSLELCAICEGGWVTSTCWIDHEDLFRVHPQLKDRRVESDKWETLTVRDGSGNTQVVPCHYIYLAG